MKTVGADYKDQNSLKAGIYALDSRWERCIEAKGAYFIFLVKNPRLAFRLKICG